MSKVHLPVYAIFVSTFFFTVVCRAGQPSNGVNTLHENNNTSLDVGTTLIAYGEYVEGRMFKRIGTISVIIAGATLIPGIVIFSKLSKDGDSETSSVASIPFFVTSGVSLLLAIPMLISGTKKKEKYKKLIDSPVLSLSTNNWDKRGTKELSVYAQFSF